MSQSSIQARLPKSRQTLYLVDISSFIFRAFFAIRALKNKAGEPTNAVYGVATMLARLEDDAKPEHLAVVYDSKEPSFRSEIYADYKANRSECPEDLVPQFDRIEALISGFEIPTFRQSGVEADDLIATLTRKWCKLSKDNHVVIVSSDKDLMQLVDSQVVLWDTMSNKIYGATEVKEKFGVRPDQIRDYLALVGDSSDNIPGVAGIGPKTASELLGSYGTLQGVLVAAKEGKISGKKAETIKNSEADALLSAELATVKEDLKVSISQEAFSYRFHMSDMGIELLKSLDFHSLVTKWEKRQETLSLGFALGDLPVIEGASKIQLQPEVFKTINTESQFQNLLEKIEKTGEFGFDLETTSLNPRKAEIVGLAVCYDPQFGTYIPIGHRDSSVAQLPAREVLARLKPFLENPKYKKIGQNLKYDWSVLIQHGIKPQGIGADTMVAAYLLDPDGRHNLKTLSAQYLDYNVLSYEEVCGKGKDQISFDQLSVDVATRYSAEDAWIALKLWNTLKPRLESEKLEQVLTQIELPMVEILTRMELQGVCIDVPWLNQLSKEFGEELKKIEEQVQVFSEGPINLNSPKQLGKLLFEVLKLPTQGKTKTGFSTDASVLEALAPMHEVPRLLLEYREISKLKGTYVDPLPELRDMTTGKIHASFHQTVAATGRLSSSEPNLQNIPIRTERGTRIRRAFVPEEGNVLISADYSQIELRLLAHMSGDAELIRSFKKDEDIHRRTAGEIFGISPEQVNDQQRGIAKAINFGLMYGKTAFGLSQELKIPRKEAQEVIQRYFERYHSVKKFLDQEVSGAKEKGYVMTLNGRKRWLHDIASKNHAVRANAERMAMNTPLQGTAADLMKLAMIEIDKRLEKGGYQSKLIIQVHDEVLLDCPKKEVEEVKNLVTESMEGAMSLDVPLRVNSASGNNWMEL
jgi:DNA polymerase-1